MAEGHLLQFHEDMEACVTRIVNTMRVTWPNGCKLGDVDVSSVIIRYLWHKYLSKCPDIPDAESCANAIKEVEKTLLPLVSFKARKYEEQDYVSNEWHKCLKGEENKVMVFVTSLRILYSLKPLINSLKEDFVLLSTTPVPDGFAFPRNCTVVRLSMPKAKLYCNAEMEQALPWFYNFANAIGWFIQILKPRLLICMDGCQSEYRLAAAFCNEKRIPSICLQQGWPSFIHTGFRDLPYSYFLTWGDKFNPLWEKFNKHTLFQSVGYMEETSHRGNHDAVTFFLQAPVYLNNRHYLERMCRLIYTTANRYPNLPILVREHPEYKGKTESMNVFSQCGNVQIVNDDKLSVVYARTRVVVSHFSSVLMECVMYGCIPLVFNPTPGSSYSPDIEMESIGCIAKNEETFFSKLMICLQKMPAYDLPQWFKATGSEAIANVINIVNNLL